MKTMYCNECEQVTGHQRKLGIGTIFMVLVTCGVWIFATPFYPNRCEICGSDYKTNKRLNKIRLKRKKKEGKREPKITGDYFTT